jgi:replicative DNA helicase
MNTLENSDAKELLDLLFSFLESTQAQAALRLLQERKDAELLKLMVGEDADTTQLLLAPEHSKYPQECLRIKQLSTLRTLGRLVERSKRAA